MKHWGQRVIAAALAVGVAGCAMPAKSVQELRAGAQVEVVEVARPYAEVAKALAENAAACLDKVVVENVISRGYHYHKEYRYTPRVTVGAERAELLLQRAIDGVNMIRVVEEPPGGFFFLLAEATPAGPGKTRVAIYPAKRAAKVLVPAIKRWAGGEGGCPDLTKI